MKLTALLLTVLMTLSLKAEVIHQSKHVLDEDAEVTGVRFVYSKQTLVAGINLDLRLDDRHDDEIQYGDLRIKVASLSFDPAKGERGSIVYTDGNGDKTVCATVERKGLFNIIQYVKETGLCTINVDIEKIEIEVNNGWSLRTVTQVTATVEAN